MRLLIAEKEFRPSDIAFVRRFRSETRVKSNDTKRANLTADGIASARSKLRVRDFCLPNAFHDQLRSNILPLSLLRILVHSVDRLASLRSKFPMPSQLHRDEQRSDIMYLKMHMDGLNSIKDYLRNQDHLGTLRHSHPL